MESLGKLTLTQIMEKAAFADNLIQQRRKACSKYRELNHQRENERSKLCMRNKYQRDKEAKAKLAEESKMPII